MASVAGIDSSPEMLERARPLAMEGRLEFFECDIARWTPAEPFELIVSNAALQWVDDHAGLLERLAGACAGWHSGCSDAQSLWQPIAGSHRGNVVRSALGRGAGGCGTSPGFCHAGGMVRRAVASPGLGGECLGDDLHPCSPRREPGSGVAEGDGLAAAFGPTGRALASRVSAPRRRAILRAYPPSGDITLFPMPRLFFVATKGDR